MLLLLAKWTLPDAHAKLNEVWYGAPYVCVIALEEDKCLWILSTTQISNSTFTSSGVRRMRVMRGPSRTVYGDDDAFVRFRDCFALRGAVFEGLAYSLSFAG